jgi:hypothetical protein
VSVLVYPGKFTESTFDVIGFHGRPVQLVALGMDLYGYRRGTGDAAHADALERVIGAVTPAT